MTPALRVVLAVLVLLAVAGCPRKKDGGATAQPDPSSAIVVKPDSENLLLTWIDDKGEFHVEQKVADVPLTGRDAVRVVDPSRSEGTSSGQIFVADLRQTKPDGTYSVSTMSRAQFELLATARRAKNGPVLANADDGTRPSQGAATPSPAPQAAAPDDTTDPTARPTVIMYGADWCKPCKATQAYLTQRKISFIEKNIDDEAIQREVRAKVAKAHVQYKGEIPVLDVRGKILIGFDPQRLEDALGKPL